MTREVVDKVEIVLNHLFYHRKAAEVIEVANINLNRKGSMRCKQQLLRACSKKLQEYVKDIVSTMMTM